MILSAAWGVNSGGTVAWHEWKGLNKMQYKLQDYIAKQNAESLDGGSLRRSSRLGQHMPGSFTDPNDEDDEDDDYIDEDEDD